MMTCARPCVRAWGFVRFGKSLVRASAANRDRQYKLADGSLIPHKGQKTFKAVTNAGLEKQLTASVTDVDKPLLSVAQIVRSGSRVIFDTTGSYVEDENKERIWLDQQGGLYTLKMWVPRDQGTHFPGRA